MAILILNSESLHTLTELILIRVIYIECSVNNKRKSMREVHRAKSIEHVSDDL